MRPVIGFSEPAKLIEVSNRIPPTSHPRGLDRDDPAALEREMERLHLSSRRLIWLNPLLRFDGFAPRAQGIRAMLPHVDSFRAGHSIASLEDLAAVISRSEDVGEKARLMAMLQAG